MFNFKAYHIEIQHVHHPIRKKRGYTAAQMTTLSGVSHVSLDNRNAKHKGANV